MEEKKLLNEIEENIVAVINKDTPLGLSLWEALIVMHPADIANFLGVIDRNSAQKVYVQFSRELQFTVFSELSEAMKVFTLSFMGDQERIDMLHALPIDELTDLFDHFSDKELKMYLNLLHKKERQKVLSLLQFETDSAGGIMDIEVLTLVADYTVEKSTKLLQRLRPKEVYQQIYIVSRTNLLEGHINLQDLVLQPPQERIGTFMQKNELVAQAKEDQEDIAKRMVHYKLMTVPVVDSNNSFLGVIPSETLVRVLTEEATENVHKMAALHPIMYPYFEMSFFRLFYQRSYVLIALLVAESFSGNILRTYGTTLTAILISFIPMLTSAGGNTGSQVSAVVIQGLASGEFDFTNMARLLRREFLIAGTLSTLLTIVSFLRVYFIGGSIIECLSVAGSLGLIVLISALLGSSIPFFLRKLNIDPAFSAGPFLATLMDILGILIFCYMSRILLI